MMVAPADNYITGSWPHRNFGMHQTMRIVNPARLIGCAPEIGIRILWVTIGLCEATVAVLSTALRTPMSLINMAGPRRSAIGDDPNHQLDGMDNLVRSMHVSAWDTLRPLLGL